LRRGKEENLSHNHKKGGGKYSYLRYCFSQLHQIEKGDIGPPRKRKERAALCLKAGGGGVPPFFGDGKNRDGCRG